MECFYSCWIMMHAPNDPSGWLKYAKHLSLKNWLIEVKTPPQLFVMKNKGGYNSMQQSY